MQAGVDEEQASGLLGDCPTSAAESVDSVDLLQRPVFVSRDIRDFNQLMRMPKNGGLGGRVVREATITVSRNASFCCKLFSP